MVVPLRHTQGGFNISDMAEAIGTPLSIVEHVRPCVPVLAPYDAITPQSCCKTTQQTRSCVCAWACACAHAPAHGDMPGASNEDDTLSLRVPQVVDVDADSKSRTLLFAHMPPVASGLSCYAVSALAMRATPEKPKKCIGLRSRARPPKHDGGAGVTWRAPTSKAASSANTFEQTPSVTLGAQKIPPVLPQIRAKNSLVV